MLVLSRKPKEEIVLRMGDVEVLIELVEIRHPRSARIGITAPKHVQVNRREVWDKICQGDGHASQDVA